ncbi:MAG TPA: phosphoenolpyruvate carboxykinase, partial [Opitutaceae bacterium]|nr:phosphoenolpyruvate carboxykinase [Opitutaceae bacterium]
MSTKRNPSTPLSTNKQLLAWVEQTVALCQPDRVHWVDGSQEENDALCAELVAAGTYIKLNEKLWPGCFYAKSDPGD